MYKKIVLTILMVISFSASAYAGQDVWDDFLSTPNEANYVKCDMDISNSISMPEDALKENPDYKPLEGLMKEGNLQRLLELIDNGNHYARHLGFRLYTPMANNTKAIEGLNISLGKLFKNNPRYFLMSLNKHEKRNIGKAFPVDGILDTFDENTRKDKVVMKNEVQARLEALEKVNIPELKGLKGKFISRLNKTRAEIK